MQELNIIVSNKVGLHARPVSILVKTAMGFKSKIVICKGNQVADAKSMLTILAMGVTNGTEITLRAEGKDEVKAIDSLKNLFESNFGELE